MRVGDMMLTPVNLKNNLSKTNHAHELMPDVITDHSWVTTK